MNKGHTDHMATSAVTQEFATLITNAFSIVAALAWSEAIRNLLQTNLLEDHPLVGPLVFAVMVTMLTYLVSTTIGKKGKQPCTALCTPAPSATQRPTQRSA